MAKAAPRHAWVSPEPGASGGGEITRCRSCGTERRRTAARKGSIYAGTATTRYRVRETDEWDALRPPCHDPHAPIQFGLFAARPDDADLPPQPLESLTLANVALEPTSSLPDAAADSAEAIDAQRMVGISREAGPVDSSKPAASGRPSPDARAADRSDADAERMRRADHARAALRTGSGRQSASEQPYTPPPFAGPLPDGIAWEVVLDMERETDVMIIITLPFQEDPFAGSRKLRRHQDIEKTCRMFMENAGRRRGARCDAWDRDRKLSWVWICDGKVWRASDDVREAPWVAAERERVARREWQALHKMTALHESLNDDE